MIRRLLTTGVLTITLVLLVSPAGVAKTSSSRLYCASHMTDKHNQKINEDTLINTIECIPICMKCLLN